MLLPYMIVFILIVANIPTNSFHTIIFSHILLNSFVALNAKRNVWLNVWRGACHFFSFACVGECATSKKIQRENWRWLNIYDVSMWINWAKRSKIWTLRTRAANNMSQNLIVENQNLSSSFVWLVARHSSANLMNNVHSLSRQNDMWIWIEFFWMMLSDVGIAIIKKNFRGTSAGAHSFKLSSQ